MHTNKDMRLSVNRITTITVPAGTEVERIPGGFGGQGDAFAIKDPLKYVDKEDALAVWDAQHHYFWVLPSDIDGL